MLRNRALKNRQTELEQNRRQGNHLNDFLQSKKLPLGQNPLRQTVNGALNRQENEVLRNKFNKELNLSRMNGIGKPIQFNNTDLATRRRMRLKQMERRRKLDSITSTTLRPIELPTTTTTTTTPAPYTTLAPTEPYINYQFIEGPRLSQPVVTENRYEAELRRKLDEEQIELQRQMEENRLREEQLLESQRRRQRIEEEERQQLENERIREDKIQQDILEARANQQNQIGNGDDDDSQRQQQPQQQRELIHQRSQQAKQIENQQRLLQTNEVIDTKPQPKPVNDQSKQETPDEKKKRLRQDLLERLQKLPSDERKVFLAKLKEQNISKKRQT